MRSDLNIVTNTVDEAAYDVSDIKVRIDILDSEIAETQKVTQHLQKDIDNVRLVINIALALGTVGSIASIGMQIAPQGIQFFTKLGSNMLRNIAKGSAPKAISDAVGFTIFQSIVTRSVTTDISPILEWSEEEYKELFKIAFDDELDDPDINAVSLTTTLDISNRFRDTLRKDNTNR